MSCNKEELVEFNVVPLTTKQRADTTRLSFHVIGVIY